MLYSTIVINNNEYKLRLTAAASIELEKKLGGKNPLGVLTAFDETDMPSLSNLLAILHASMQRFHHNIKFTDVMDLYDQYVEDGKSYTDLIPDLIEVFRISGFFPKDKLVENKENL